MISPRIRQAVWRRAESRCEYCRIHQAWNKSSLQVEHVIAKQHGGSDHLDNLALSCNYCNLHKGPNISGLDPLGRSLTRLFNPRQDVWPNHFEFAGEWIIGLTPIGRTTIVVLALNSQRRLDRRIELIAQGKVF